MTLELNFFDKFNILSRYSGVGIKNNLYISSIVNPPICILKQNHNKIITYKTDNIWNALIDLGMYLLLFCKRSHILRRLEIRIRIFYCI